MKTTDSRKRKLLESFRNGLIVSCQVQPDDPIYSEEMPVKMAQAAQWGGAVGIRANTPEQIRAIKSQVDLPVIGLYKIWTPGTDVFITPTLEAAREVFAAGAEIVALDCTDQLIDGRPAGPWIWARTLWDPPCTAIRSRPSTLKNPIFGNSPGCAAT